MLNKARIAYRVAAGLFLVGVLGQVFLAGQGLLPHLRSVIPALAALHPVNALVIFWIALVLARRAQAVEWAQKLRKPTFAARQSAYRRPAHLIEP